MTPKKQITETVDEVSTRNIKNNLCKCGAWKRNNKIYSEQTPNGTILCSNCN